MSEVKLLYDSEDIFSNVGPTPFISRDVQNIYSNSDINLVDTLSLTGRIKRNYPDSVTGPTGATGATGSSYSPCESGFQGIKNVADFINENTLQIKAPKSVKVMSAQFTKN
jgi:hypothetical protein